MLCARTALVLPVCVPNSNLSPSVKLANEYRTPLLKADNTLSIPSKPFFLTSLRALNYIKRKVSGSRTGLNKILRYRRSLRKILNIQSLLSRSVRFAFM